jgi:hypothetical protein
MNSADVAMIIFDRLHFLGKTVDHKDFCARAEELMYIMERIREQSGLKAENTNASR